MRAVIIALRGKIGYGNCLELSISDQMEYLNFLIKDVDSAICFLSHGACLSLLKNTIIRAEAISPDSQLCHR